MPYQRLRKPLERRIYELARKHCGRQPEWQVGLAVLHKKTGSTAPIRVFRAAVRRMIEADLLPDYSLSEEEGDRIRVPPRDPVLRAATLEAARALMPGMDVYALEAEWRGVWEATGSPRLRSPDAAFLGWLKRRCESSPSS